MALNIYEPMKFRSQGIEDLATQETLVISNGKITVDIVESKQSLNFADQNFSAVEGKGIKWTDGNRVKAFVYKGAQIQSDLSINLAEEQDYKIDSLTVLNLNELGSTVVKSKLREVGILRNLRVAGSASFGEFAFINSELNRIGINTDSPAGALGIRENNIDLVLGSSKTKAAQIGTSSNDDLELVTDGQSRLHISRNGEITVGDSNTENGVLRVYGKIIATEVETERSGSIVLKEQGDSTLYGKGLIWRTNSRKPNRQFVFNPNPDKFFSTDSIDLAEEKYFSIENSMVLSKGMLGPTVVNSSLTSLGVLKDLQVAGDAAITRTLSTSRIELGRFAVNENKLESQREFVITLNGAEEFRLSSNIVIGNANNTSRPVTVYGKLAVGAANPDPNIALTVEGNVSFGGKKFEIASSAPLNGNYIKGDIVWNNDPKAGDYVGWVCVTTGSPGAWLPFGGISR